MQRQALTIHGYRDESLKNTFLRQEDETQHIAIVLPGMGYSAQMPLLYYAAQLLLARGADVLAVEYAYNLRPEFQTMSGREQMQWVAADVNAAVDAALAQRAYTHVTLVGKSLGTLAMGHLFANDARVKAADAIWLTPLLRNERLVEQIKQSAPRSLFVTGSADPVYDAAALDALLAATHGDAVVIPDADHSMEIQGDVLRSLDALLQVMQAVHQFLR